jgi:hypothetical protein
MKSWLLLIPRFVLFIPFAAFMLIGYFLHWLGSLIENIMEKMK